MGGHFERNKPPTPAELWKRTQELDFLTRRLRLEAEMAKKATDEKTQKLEAEIDTSNDIIATTATTKESAKDLASQALLQVEVSE